MKETAETKQKIKDVYNLLDKTKDEASKILVELYANKRYLSIKNQVNLEMIEIMALAIQSRITGGINDLE